MTLRDLGGIFSRYFLVGFFLPAFAALTVGSLLVAPSLAPRVEDDPAVLSRVVVLAALALLGGLLLLGMRTPVIRLFEGYPLVSLRARYARESRLLPDWVRPSLLADRLWEWRVERQRARRDELRRDRSPQGQREFERRFGAKQLELDLLPTRFGNILRAFEYHANSRWGLSGLVAWPRIAVLLTDRERDYHADAETDVMFFLNFCLVSLTLGVLLVVHALEVARVTDALGGCGLLIAAWAFYRLTLQAAISWGVEVRASVDLHRLELYERLGVRMPDSFSDERAVAESVTRCLEFGEHLADSLWGPRTWKT